MRTIFLFLLLRLLLLLLRLLLIVGFMNWMDLKLILRQMKLFLSLLKAVYS